MGTSLLLLILSAGLQVSHHSSCHSFKPSSFKPFSLSPQVSALPRTLILLLLFLTAFIWISSILILIIAARLKWIYWDVTQSFSLRLAITVFTIILVYSVGQMNIVSLSLHCRINVHPLLPPPDSSLVSATVRASLTSPPSPIWRKSIMKVTDGVRCHSTFHSQPLSRSFACRYF